MEQTINVKDALGSGIMWQKYQTENNKTAKPASMRRQLEKGKNEFEYKITAAKETARNAIIKMLAKRALMLCA